MLYSWAFYPNYKKSVDEVFIDIPIRSLVYHQNLNILDLITEPDHSSNLPSWAPRNWGILQPGQQRHAEFGEAMNWYASKTSICEIKIILPCLTVTGNILDLIEQTFSTPRLYHRGFFEATLHSSDSVCRERLRNGQDTNDSVRSQYLKTVAEKRQILQRSVGCFEEILLNLLKRGISPEKACAMIYYSIKLESTVPNERIAHQRFVAYFKSLQSMDNQLANYYKEVESNEDFFLQEARLFTFALNNEENEEDMISPSTLTGNQTWGITTRNFLVISFNQAENGDKISVIKGGPAVYVFRLAGEDFRFVSTAFVYGLMEGQALDDLEFEKNVHEITIRR
jgi:hypothetical protein